MFTLSRVGGLTLKCMLEHFSWANTAIWLLLERSNTCSGLLLERSNTSLVLSLTPPKQTSVRGSERGGTRDRCLSRRGGTRAQVPQQRLAVVKLDLDLEVVFGWHGRPMGAAAIDARQCTKFLEDGHDGHLRACS